MHYIARHKQVIGRIAIKRVLRSIIRPDQTKDTTKFILVDGVGPEAALAGIKVGDIVVPTAMAAIKLDGGSCIRAMLEEPSIGAVVGGLSPGELVIQTDNGKEYVPFDDERAAKSMCLPEAPVEAAAE